MNKNRLVLLFLILVTSFTAKSQDSIPFQKEKKYILGDFTVVGLQKFSEQTVKVFSGLRVDQEIQLPGDKLSSAIKKLYDSKQFSEIDVYATKIDGDVIYLEFKVVELPQLNKVTFKGVKKNKAKELQKETELNKGVMVTDNLLITTENYLKNKYHKKGFLKTKVTLETKKDTSNTNSVDMLVMIDKGERIKIKNINIVGNEGFKDQAVKKSMKKTKESMLGRFWKPSKYIEADYKTDLENIITKYSEKGHRDARIINESISWNDDNTINIDINLEEGKKYFFGDIKFIGNKKYTDEQLQSILKIQKGEVYNGKILKERIKGNNKPDSDDIQTLYLNTGYLFAQVNPVETKIDDDVIEIEVRIHEDEQATIRKVTVTGNDKTNDRVIYRELRTRPGNLFSKDDIIRSIREIGQLGFFDAETISPDVNPNYLDKTVDIDYSVTEKGSSQIELQGGYGGGAFIGTLGLSFNNFSIKGLFDKEAYKPLPMGDGQKLALKLQTSKYYSTYSFSFSEPWLGGKRPKSLSYSIYNSRQYRYDYYTGSVDKDQRINIIGLSLGLGQRLNWPDDYFTLSQNISYQQYDLQDYPIATFSFSTGNVNNLSYGISFGRNSSGPSPIFPKYGSEFSIGGKFTIPYSLLNEKDYTVLEDSEKYKWLEYYKLNFKGRWYTSLPAKFVLMSNLEFGLLGNYNSDLGTSPFERYFVGGDGMAAFQMDGRETIALRGYENNRLSSIEGGTIYNKFTMEVRYPVSLKPSASIYLLGFMEGGNSYDGFKKFNPFEMKRSLGMGMRIFMPAFGVLGIDFANGIDPLPGTNVKSGWQTHFIIGQQF
ncbi:MAG: outer membrane protein assembly factor BamA [Flavobacteriaceae bacterium]|jgi:outer membrane protein insertion porin family|nr:outer membrane protein assembly factor BamA [Flavobacteriaceae bacterium]